MNLLNPGYEISLLSHLPYYLHTSKENRHDHCIHRIFFVYQYWLLFSCQRDATTIIMFNMMKKFQKQNGSRRQNDAGEVFISLKITVKISVQLKRLVECRNAMLGSLCNILSQSNPYLHQRPKSQNHRIKSQNQRITESKNHRISWVEDHIVSRS